MTDKQDRNHSLCCDQIAESLPLYIYDDVSAHERNLIEEHMECCGKCRSELLRLEFVSRTLDLNSDESSSLQPRTAIENMSSLNSVERSRDVYFWVKTCISIAALGLVVIEANHVPRRPVEANGMLPATQFILAADESFGGRLSR